MIYLKDKRGKEALFVHVPKTGGSTLTRYIKNNFEWRPANEINGVGASHMYLRFIDKSAPTIATTRHPITWMESLWKMLYSMNGDQAKFRFKGFAPIGTSHLMYKNDFADFIDNVLEVEPMWYTEVMSWYFGQKHNEIDYVIKMENLLEDFSNALSEIDIQHSKAKLLKAKTYGNRIRDCVWRKGQKEKIQLANRQLMIKFGYEFQQD